MPGLVRQVVPVLLKGLDQLAPRQTGIMSGLDNLLNMYAQQGEQGGYEFAPRPGTTVVARPGGSGGTVGSKLARLADQLLAVSDTALWRYAADPVVRWHRIGTGTFRLSSQKTTPIYTEANSATSCDVGYVGGYTVTAAATQMNSGSFAVAGIAITIVDANGASLDVPFRITTGGAQQVRIAVVGTFAVIFWADNISGAISAAKFDSVTGFLTGPSTLIANVAMSFTPIFDVQATANSTIAIIWNDNTTSLLNGALLTPSTMAISASTAYNLKGTSFVTKGFVANSFVINANLMFAYITSTGAHVDVVNSTTMAPTANSSIGGAPIVTGASITGYRTSGVAATVFYTVKGTLPFDDVIMRSVGGAAPVAFMAGRAIASRATDQSAGDTSLPLMLTKYRGVGQVSYFFIDGQPQDMSRSMPDVGGADPTNALVGLTTLPSLTTGANASTYLTSALKSIALDSGATGLTSITGAAIISFVMGDSTVGRAVELNGTLHFPASLPMLYDGQSLVEDGFPIFPEQSDAYVLAGGGGLTASSTYTYRYVFEWADNTGALHKSGPNLVAQQAVLGPGQTLVTHSIPAVINSRKQVVTVAIERTPSNGDGSVFYKAGAVTFVPTPGVTRVPFTDTMSDAVLVSGIPLYTDGGILENLAPPPCTTMAVHRGRILVGGVDGDPTAVWFSKDVVPGFGIAFSDALVSRLNSANETVTALGSMDSYAAAFTATTTWSTSDDYPDDTGAGGVLKFNQASATNGCAGARLIARGDDGLMCWQAKTSFAGGPGQGPWRLSRGLAWEWIGAPIQLDAAAMTPRAILAVPGLNQMRILGSAGGVGGNVLVRETTFETWATWTYLTSPLGAPTIVDAIVWGSTVAYLCADGQVVLEDTSVYGDSATAVAHSITLTPFNFGGVAGYQRIYVGQLTGRMLGTAGLGESMALNVTQTIDGTAMTAKSRTLSPDNDALFAGFEFDPGPNGKCSAYQLTISNVAAGGDSRCAWTLAAVTMEVGVKPNVNRLPPAKRAL